jgi:hypothetical protein
MNKMMVLMTLCCGLVAGAVLANDEKASATAGAVKSRTFNVLNYGAVGDDKTDNTAAFSKCLDVVIAAGGGTMYIPDGIYQGRIIIPPVSKPTPSWITVKIVGESEPAPIFGTIGSFPLQNHGTILKCLDTSGPAVISASTAPPYMYMNFSGVYVVLRDLDVRTYDNPAISGIDLGYAVQCRLENVYINTGVYNVQSSKPTHGTKGLVTPVTGNAGLTILRNVTVTGYHTGILVYEHTDADSISLGSCINGLEFGFAHHASRFGRVSAMRCTQCVTVTGKHSFSIQQLAIEDNGPKMTTPNTAWQVNVNDLDDPKNLGSGDINYWVCLGNVGAVDDFTINGGAHIRARRIGQEPENASGNETIEIKSASASSRIDTRHDAGKARDGILADHEQNYWSTANHQDVGSWWQEDLGEISSISQIQVHFRVLRGSYHFVPKTITFQVSDDGSNWRTVVSKSANVPAIKSASDGKPYTYAINDKGRYVRLLFEDGTDVARVSNIKAVALVEVKVTGGIL